MDLFPIQRLLARQWIGFRDFTHFQREDGPRIFILRSISYCLRVPGIFGRISHFFVKYVDSLLRLILVLLALSCASPRSLLDEFHIFS